MSTDGRVAQAPGDAAAFSTRRALLSPDGQWFPIYGECCGSYVRLLRRDGGEVKDVVPSPTDGSGIGFVGWDQNGLLLYQQIWPDHSTLIAVGLDGTQHYSVAAPAELGGVMWNVAVTAADRSWLVVALGKGIGAQPQVYRLLVDGQLRSLPAEVEASKAFGLFNLGNELLYRAGDGSMRAYDVRAGATRTLSLVVARGAASGLIMVGNSDQFFVWMELSRGLIGDLQTGRSVEVTLQSPPTVDRLDGTILAEYRDDSVGIYDLAELTRSR
jgi:hypothetical protein